MMKAIREHLRIANSLSVDEEARSQALVQLFLVLEKGSQVRNQPGHYDALIPDLSGVELSQEERQDLIKELNRLLVKEKADRIRSTILWGFGTAGVDLIALTLPALLKVLQSAPSLKPDEFRQALLSLDRLLSPWEDKDLHPKVRQALHEADVQGLVVSLSAIGRDHPKEKTIMNSVCKKLMMLT